MKNWFLLLAFIFCASAGFAQAQQTLFKRARVTGGFGSLLFENRLGNSKAQTAMGGGGGLAFGDVFVGGYGVGAVDFDALFDGRDVDQLEIGHGGLWVGLNIPTRKVLHGYVSGRFGWGAVEVPFDDPNIRYSDIDRIFVMTPEAGIELNVFSWFRIAGSLGYRYTSGIREGGNLSNKDFSGAFYGINLRFGGF
jgi:hypothetical protein